MTIHRATTPDQLASLSGEPLAGGTDLWERLHSGVASGPVVDLNGLPDFDSMRVDDAGAAVLGAGVRLTDLAADERIRGGWPGLAETAGTLATPQIRNVATLGGVLCQRTRCTWYRHPHFSCFKTGGEGCPAQEAKHEHGVLFDLGPCVHPHPSSVALAMLVYDGTFDTNLRTAVPIAELYGDGGDPTRDHRLDPGEVLLRLHLPPREGAEELPRVGYSRLMGRQAAEWPWVECLVQLRIEGARVVGAGVAIGAVATIPLRAPSVEAALQGVAVGDLEAAAAAAATALEMHPIREAGRHKVAMLTGTLLDAIEKAWRVEPIPGPPPAGVPVPD